MSFGMNYEEDFKATQMRYQAYREEAQQERLLRELRNAQPRKNFASTAWHRFLDRVNAKWPAKQGDVLNHPPVPAHRTSG